MSQSWVARALPISPRSSRRQRRASRQGKPSTFRPRLEILEDRTLPSIAFTNFSVPPTTASSGQLTLNGTISDTNSPTSISVTINWGDRISSTVSASSTSTPGIFVFTASHNYPNPPSAGNPVFTVTASAKDSTRASIRSTEAALTVDGLQGNEGITVAPGSRDLVQVTVGTFTGSFDHPVYGGPIAVFGGPSASAADTIVVNEGLSLPVTVYGGTNDGLTVKDPTPTDTIAITNNTVQANGGTVTYSGLSSLLVSGLGGGDTVTMTGIAAGVATTVDGVSGNTSFNGSFGAAGFNGNLTLDNFVTAKLTDAGNFSGDLTVNSPGNLQQLSVAGTIVAGSSISAAGALSGGTIGTNAGTIGAGSISGMSFTTNSGTIRAAGQGTISNVSIGTNTGTFAAVEGTTPGSGRMTSITIGSNAGLVSAGSFSAMSITSNSGTIRASGQGTTSNVTIGTNTSTGTFGAVEDTNAGSGTMTSTTIGSNAGTVSAGSISTMSVQTNSGTVSAAGQGNASNVTIGTMGASGTFTATGTLTDLSVTVFSGLVVAGHVGKITALNSPGTSRMLDVIEGGVTRQLVLTPASGSSLPQFVNYVYDHTGSGDPQLTMAVNDGINPGSYDVELLTNAAPVGSGFDLAALYAVPSTTAHVRNVLVEGNLTPNAADASQVGISSSVGGVQLPGVALGSVGIMGNAPAGSVNAASIQAVSFASITESSGTVAASAATPSDAAQLLTPGTAIVQANNTFLAAAGQTALGQSQPVALFLDTGASAAFDPNNVLLGNQGNVIGAANPVAAQVTATVPSAGSPTTIQTITLTGDGGSIQTARLIASAITSSGALGDLLLQAGQGIVANITAPSIFGNINAPNGPISSIIQTTVGNIGRTLTTNGTVTGVTSIQTPFALSGEIISAADLISQVVVGNTFTSTGVIAAGGNLGYLDPSTLNRFGGLSISSGFNGDAVALGNIFGDISITGGLNGRIAAQGASDVLGSGRQGIVGNIEISGGIRNTAAVVSGGEIGDNGLGTGIIVNSGTAKGILAAVGPISSVSTGQTKFAFVFNDVGNPSSPQYAGGVNAAAINAIYSGLTIGNLATILINLNNLHVGSDGNLSDT